MIKVTINRMIVATINIINIANKCTNKCPNNINNNVNRIIQIINKVAKTINNNYKFGLKEADIQ